MHPRKKYILHLKSGWIRIFLAMWSFSVDFLERMAIQSNKWQIEINSNSGGGRKTLKQQQIRRKLMSNWNWIFQQQQKNNWLNLKWECTYQIHYKSSSWWLCNGRRKNKHHYIKWNWFLIVFFIHSFNFNFQFKKKKKKIFTTNMNGEEEEKKQRIWIV